MKFFYSKKNPERLNFNFATKKKETKSFKIYLVIADNNNNNYLFRRFDVIKNNIYFKS